MRTNDCCSAVSDEAFVSSGNVRRSGSPTRRCPKKRSRSDEAFVRASVHECVSECKRKRAVSVIVLLSVCLSFLLERERGGG